MLLPVATAHLAASPVPRVTAPTALDVARLVDLDFRQPRPTRLPPTAGELEAALGVTAGSVSSYIRFDDDVAPYLDVGPVQSHVVHGVGGLGYQRAVGLWTGLSMVDGRAIETRENSTDRFVSQTNAGWDINGASGGTIVIVFRFGRNTTTTRRLAGKLNGSARGWRLDRVASSQLQFGLIDNAGTANSVTLIGALNTEARGWHYVAVQVDRATQLMRIMMPGGEQSASSALVATGDPAAPMFIGEGSGTNAGSLQVAAMFRLPGTNATINKALLDAWWRQGKDWTGHVDTYARAGTMATRAGHVAGEGEYLAAWDTNQMGVAYNPVFLHPSKLGLQTTLGFTQLLSDTRLENWALGGGLVRTANAAVSPFGMTEAVRLAAAGTPGTIDLSFAATNGVVYQLSCFVWADAATTVSLVVTDAGGTPIFTDVRAVTIERRQLSINWTAGATAGFRFRLIVPAGVTVYADMPQIQDTPSVRNGFVWVPASAGSTTVGATTVSLSGAVGEYQKGAVGTVRVTAAADRASLPVGDSVMVSATATANRRDLSTTEVFPIRGRVWDSAGVEQAIAATPDDEISPELEHVSELEWSATTAISAGVFSRVRVDGGPWFTGDVDGWTATDAAPTINIGHRNGVNQFPGTIARVEFFSARA